MLIQLRFADLKGDLVPVISRIDTAEILHMDLIGVDSLVRDKALPSTFQKGRRLISFEAVRSYKHDHK